MDEREELKKAYPQSKGWAEKVKRMSDKQVKAIFIRLRSEGKLGR